MPPRDTGKRKDVDRPANDGDHPSHNQAHPPLDMLREGASERMRLRSPGPEHRIWELPDTSEEGLKAFLAGQQSHREAGAIPHRRGLRSLVRGTNASAKGWYRDGEMSPEEHLAAYKAKYYADPKNREHQAAYKAKYYADPKNREHKKKHDRDYNAKPEKKALRAEHRADPETKARQAAYDQAYAKMLRDAKRNGIDKEEALAAARLAGNAALARWDEQHPRGGEARASGEGQAREVGPVAGSSTGARESRESQQRRQQEERDAEMARGLAAGQDKEEWRQERGQGGARGGGHDRRDRRSEQPEGRSEPRSEQERGQERLGGAQEEQERLRARAEALVAARAEAREREQDDRWLQQNAETIWLDRGNGTPNEPRRTVRVTDGDRRLQRGIRTDEERWGQRGIRTDGDRRRYRRAEGAEIEQYLAWEEQAIQRGRQSSSLGGALGGR